VRIKGAIEMRLIATCAFPSGERFINKHFLMEECDSLSNDSLLSISWVRAVPLKFQIFFDWIVIFKGSLANPLCLKYHWFQMKFKLFFSRFANLLQMKLNVFFSHFANVPKIYFVQAVKMLPPTSCSISNTVSLNALFMLTHVGSEGWSVGI
jgi:hypothetical protein